MPELTEEELRRYRQLETTMQSMLRHPKGGELVEQALKLVDEKAPTPRLDAATRDEQIRKESADRIAALEKQIADDRAQREQESKLNGLAARRDAGMAQLRSEGWTDEGIKGVEKIMEEQGILDPAIAAAYFEKLHPPTAPVTPGGSGAWNFMEMPADNKVDFEKMIETKGQSEGLLNKMVNEALTDFRGQGRR